MKTRRKSNNTTQKLSTTLLTLAIIYVILIIITNCAIIPMETKLSLPEKQNETQINDK